MAKEKQTPTHTAYTMKRDSIDAKEVVGGQDDIVIIVPKGTSYVTIRNALERAIVRVR